MGRQWMVYFSILCFAIIVSDVNGMDHKLVASVTIHGAATCGPYSTMGTGARSVKCKEAKKASNKSFSEVVMLTVHDFSYTDTDGNAHTYSGVLCHEDPYLIVVGDSNGREWCVST